MEFKKRNIKIYILSGYAKSGKDEVSKIITNYFSDKKVITISYGHYIKDYARRIIGDFNEFNKPRTFLQNFGIELVKEKIDDKLFIRRILEDIENEKSTRYMGGWGLLSLSTFLSIITHNLVYIFSYPLFYYLYDILYKSF